MPTYQYEALDAGGRSERGMLDADSERGARQALRARGLLPLSVSEARGRGRQAWMARARISDADLGWLTRQLASLLSASLPLEAALRATFEQAERRHVARVLAQVRDDVRAGLRFG